MKISEYNINHGYLDTDNVKLLKKGIEDGYDIPITYYNLNDKRYIIDGGHAYTAYTELNIKPPVCLEVPYTTPEDMIAYSRHRNVNRIEQCTKRPFSYANSIVEEVKRRLNIKDDEVKSVFKKYRNVESRKEKDEHNVVFILNKLFENEPVEPDTFTEHYLPLLNLPEPIQKKIQEGINTKADEITKSHAVEVSKLKDKTKQEKLVDAISDSGLSVRDTKEAVKEVNKGKDIGKAIHDVSLDKAIKHSKNKNNKIKRELLMPDTKFDIIYADPPWEYDFSETENRAIESHYPTMILDEIKNLKVPVVDNAVLFLWATAPKIREALEVMESWGFDYKSQGIWDKEKIGMGYWFRGQHEILLVGTKGEVSPPEESSRKPSVYSEKRGEHSKKPDYYYELIENLFPNKKYIELFARKKRDKWESWGDEIK